MEVLTSNVAVFLGELAPTTWFLLLGLLFSVSFLRKALS